MIITTRFNDVEVKRMKRSEDFKLRIQMWDEDGQLYSTDSFLGVYVDDYINGRSDITQDIIQEACDNILEDLDEDIVKIKSINIVAEQDIRSTPYESRNLFDE